MDAREGAAAVLAGGALLVAVLTWRLGEGSYRQDVTVICDAERRSGLEVATEMQAVSEWTRGHLTTAAGNQLFAHLGDLPFDQRAVLVRSAAAAVGAGTCPVAASYERLVAEGACRADFQRLCSYVTFPDLALLDDAARLDALEEWLGREAGPCARAQAGPLRSADTPAARARVLRDASEAAGILTCDIAKVLEAPPPAGAGTDASGGD